MSDIAGIPYVEVDFDKNGKQLNPVAVPAGTTDVFVISHGWNNDKAEARALYKELFGNVAAQAAGFDVAAKKFAIVGIFWPSKKFDFKIAAQGSSGGGPTAAATGGGADAASETAVLEQLAELQRYLNTDTLPETAGNGQTSDAAIEAEVQAARALVPKLDTQTTARDEFVAHVRALVSDEAAHDEDGSSIFFQTQKGDEIMRKLLIDEDDLAEDIINPGGATSISGGGRAAQGSGGAASIVGFFKGFTGSALNVLNYTTYYEMKSRAGTVGKIGVAPLVDQIAGSGASIHLIGHSFGGRVVTAAAASSRTDRIKSMALLQAAFSHNGFSQKGFFRNVIDEARVKGPIFITHTKNDEAVGRAYPIASRLNGDKTAALGDKNDEFGGMGRNGAQKLGASELDTGELLLREAGESYAFAARVFNLEADKFIANHGDIRGKQVAHAVLSAVAKKK
jgi:hypothetical protein